MYTRDLLLDFAFVNYIYAVAAPHAIRCYSAPIMFLFELPSVRIARRTVKFISKFNEGNCVFS